MASPVVVDADDPQDVINPAVSGALGLLKSALKHGYMLSFLPIQVSPISIQLHFSNRVNRVVFTSSTATIFAPVTKPTVLNESNWNTVTLEEVERLGRAATSHQKYRASKILAEKGKKNKLLSRLKKGQSNSFSLAVWEFYEANKERSRWDITVINPPFVRSFIPRILYISNLRLTTGVWSMSFSPFSENNDPNQNFSLRSTILKTQLTKTRQPECFGIMLLLIQERLNPSIIPIVGLMFERWLWLMFLHYKSLMLVAKD